MKPGFSKCEFCEKEYKDTDFMIVMGEMYLYYGNDDLEILNKDGKGLNSDLLWCPVYVCRECWRKINNFVVENLIPKVGNKCLEEKEAQ